MKHISRLSLLFAFLIIVIASCKKEKVEEGETSEFPPPNPSSTLSLTVDSKTYNLKVIGQSFTTGDTAKLRIDATAPELTLRLRADAAVHTSGIGDYYLACCSNDVFDRTKTVFKHWEIDHIGNGRQNGIVKITRIDSKGYEGTYTIFGNDYDVSRTAKKEFKGSFVMIY